MYVDDQGAQTPVRVHGQTGLQAAVRTSPRLHAAKEKVESLAAGQTPAASRAGPPAQTLTQLRLQVQGMHFLSCCKMSYQVVCV